jgi:CheY-like chemotaxis protein
MTRGEAKRRQALLAQLLVEALDRVAAVHVRRRVLGAALDEAGVKAIPDQIEDLTFFVSGPLYEQAQRILGSEFADELLVEVAPVLDRAWASDREHAGAPPAVQGTPLPLSAVRRTRSQSAIRKVDAATTIPADTEPAPATNEPADTTPPSIKRMTMPYLEAVLGGEQAVRVLVVHGEDDARGAISGALEESGYAVVTAHDTRVARLLLSRLTPAFIVADVETLAPDFEPLRAALEAMMGTAQAPVVLLSDERRPDMPELVRAIVSRASRPAEVLEVIEELRNELATRI